MNIQILYPTLVVITVTVLNLNQNMNKFMKSNKHPPEKVRVISVYYLDPVLNFISLYKS